MQQIINPQGALVCVALNDKSQLAALSDRFHQAPYLKPATQPVLYFKPRNTRSNNGSVMPYPSHLAEDQALYVGASLVAVIAEPCCRVSEEQALSYCAGVTLMHDFSLREESYYRPDIKGKCLDHSAAVAERITPLDNLGALDDLVVVTQLNEQTEYRFPSVQMQRSISELISSISHIMTLQSGDLIALGFAGERIQLCPEDQVISYIETGEASTVVELKNSVSKKVASSALTGQGAEQ